MIVLDGLPLAEIRAHGGAAYPEECCGALLGIEEDREPHILRAVRIPNARSEERRRRFLITPEDYRRVEALADAEGLLLLGFYHSHPDHPAVPSEYDREQALPFFHYLLLAVAAGLPGDLTAWKLLEDRGVFEREELLIQTSRRTTMAKIQLPTPLRPYAGGASSVEVSGATVAEALRGLVELHASLRKHLFDDHGELRSFVNIYKNEADIRYLAKDATPLSDGDTLSIVPSIAGGLPASGSPSETALSNEEIRRYSRHLIMPEVGVEGQKKLKAARVLAIGAGGLGSPLAVYLAAAGVGTIGLVDFDVVDDSNLQRQILFTTGDVGRPKLQAAAERLRAMNPNVEIVPYEKRLSSENAIEIFRRFDIVADGTDNFPTRYLVNDACVLTGKPNVYASIFRFEGQASVFWAEKGPCYRCLYAEPPPPGLVPSCAEGGVLGILPGLLGVIQATETIKLILGSGDPLIGRLLLVDALSMRFRELKLQKNPECVLCGPNPTVTQLVDYESFCGLPAGPAPDGGERGIPEITVEELKAMRERREDFVLVDVREPHEVAICAFPESLKIPLGVLPENLNRLSTADEIVVHCKLGGRSAKAVQLMRETGFTKVRNLAGGIDRWAERIDPAMPRY